jgi:hypothetical protein
LGFGLVVSLSRKDKIFEYIIERNHLKLHIPIEILQQETAVATEKVIND